jgi:Fur family transcriptional regulator, iron response regulator
MEMFEIAAQLKEANVKPTSQRLAITKYVLTEADHPTADEVFAWAQKNQIHTSLATVYNTLTALVIAGLLKEYRFGHSEKLIYDSNTNDHYHFLDTESGKLTDIAVDAIGLTTNLKKNFQIEGIDILFYGKN